MDIFALLEKKKQELDAQSGRRAKTEKLPAGKSRWRILPGWRGPADGTFWHDFGQHYIKAPGVEKPLAVYVCSEVTYGRPCDVCSALEEAIRLSTTDQMLNALKEGKSSRRILVNALRRDGDKPNVPVIVELPPGVFSQFAEAAGVFKSSGLNILDLATGHDIQIERVGTGLNTKYTVSPIPVPSKVDASVMTQINNLDEHVKQEYEAGLKKALAAIAQARGVSMPALTASATTSLATDPAASLPEPEFVPASAPMSAAEAAAAVIAARQATTAPAATAAVAAAAPAAPASVPTPVVVAAVAAAAASSAGDDLDALLAELDAA